MNVIEAFCRKYDFPDAAVEYLLGAFETLSKNSVCYDKYSQYVKAYEDDFEFDSEPVFAGIGDIARELGIKVYTLELLYLISLTPHLEKLYDEKNISADIYDGSVLDLKSKNQECFDVYGYYGIFVGWWTIGFFKLKRFGIGRLQYNKRRFDRDMETDGISFKKGELYIEVHIPSGRPLDRSECLASYRKACEFFKNDFGNGPIVFGCHSWLVSPNNPQMLPENSNILKFMSDYRILFNEKDEKNLNLWRIFGTFEMPGNADDLPSDTSLRRAVIEWLKKGNTIDVGFGILIMP